MRACPFCSNPSPTLEEIDLNLWAVVCNTCNTTGPIEGYDNARQSKARAIELWDKRVEPSGSNSDAN